MNVGCNKRKMPEETSEVHFKLTGMQRDFSCMFSESIGGGGSQCNTYVLEDPPPI